MRPFVVYWNNIPSPYLVERFNVLADRGNVLFQAWFNERTESDRSWLVEENAWRFSYKYLPTLTFGKRRVHLPTMAFSRHRPEVLISLYAEPAFIFGSTVARLRGTKTAYFCVKTHDRTTPRTVLKECLKRVVLPAAHAIVVPGQDAKVYATRYGVPSDKVLTLMHVVDVEHFAKARYLPQTMRTQLRVDLGLNGVTFIYVGRLCSGKGLDYLLDAFRKVQSRSHEEVSLLMVGDGYEERHLRELCSEYAIRNVVFAGFKQKSDLVPYYAVSDVFVFPTLGDTYGLVLDEALACALPIICTSAVGEIADRVEEGVNGYIIPPEESVALADRMLTLASDSEQRARMGEASAAKIVGHTPEQWAEKFEDIVQSLLAE